MSNLARPAESSRTTSLLPRSVDGLLRDLRAVRRGAPALPALPPTDYARTHAAFELLSDQRGLIAAHLAERLARRDSGPVSVLSAGCGDGTLDAPLAAALSDAAPGRPVRYVGVDPFPGSTTAFARSLHELDRPSLSAHVHTARFEDLRVAEQFDVVTFVHSMYYVRDVAQTLLAAYALLRPGGELLVLAAPRAELNTLVEVLAPSLDDHDQWFSDDVAAALRQTGLPADPVVTIEAGFDAGAASDEVLDFAVQAQLTPELRPLVRSYLDAVAVPVVGPAVEAATGWRVPHPVDVHRVVRAP